MKLSFIIPVYRGENTIEPLFLSIRNTCNKYNYSFEVIFIWDCGPDNSWNMILKLKNDFPEEVKGIRLARNFGQHDAIICGFAHASGDFMVTMDEDLQHDPEDVRLMVEKQIEKDYELVYGHYPDRQHSLFRNLITKVFRYVLAKGIPDLNRDFSAYRLIKKNLALATLDMQSSYTFLDGYFSWITSNISSVRVSHKPRLSGRSSYTLSKLISHSVNIFISFSSLPLKLVTWLSLFFLTLSSGYAIYILLDKLIFNNLVKGYASLVVLIGFGIGSILFGISVIGEYIRKINIKTTHKPDFRVSEII